MDEDQQKILFSLQETIFHGMDELFRLAHARYSDLLENPDDIYQSFVVALAQTLGRHIAAFPEQDRDQIALDALELQEEMTALVITETAKAELNKAHTKEPEVKYDLAKMKPEGSA